MRTIACPRCRGRGTVWATRCSRCQGRGLLLDLNAAPEPEQDDLFSAPEPVAHARNADPDTSHDAARSVSTKRSHADVLALLREVGPSTADALEALVEDRNLKHKPQRVRSALVELAEQGLTVKTGYKRATRTGRLGYVWALTEDVQTGEAS